MPSLTIPKQHTGGMAKLVTLSDANVDMIVHALERASVGTRQEMVALITESLPEWDSKDATEIAETLRALYGVRTGMDVPVDEFATGLVEAIRMSGPDGAAIPVERAPQLEGVFKRLLGIRPLSMISKAKDLQYEYENTFCNARVVTDLRPVFDTDIKAAPAGVVIAHTLKLEYHHAGKHTEIHVALDKEDIDNLMAVLWRAHEKAESLSSLCSAKGIDKLLE